MVGRGHSLSWHLVPRGPIRSREGGHARAVVFLSHRRGYLLAAPTGPAVAQCVATPGRSFQFFHDAGDHAAKHLPSVVSQLAHGSHHGGEHAQAGGRITQGRGKHAHG